MLSVAVAGLDLPLRDVAASTHSRRSAHSARKDPKEDEGGIPHPSHRHASPSAPWPWVDFEDGELMLSCYIQWYFFRILFSEVDREQLECSLPPIPPLCNHESCASEGKAGCWTGYPQSQFPNWTHRQVVKSRIHAALKEYLRTCTLYRIDVDKDGFFTDPGPLVSKPGDERRTWDQFIGEEVSVISA